MLRYRLHLFYVTTEREQMNRFVHMLLIGSNDANSNRKQLLTRDVIRMNTTHVHNRIQPSLFWVLLKYKESTRILTVLG